MCLPGGLETAPPSAAVTFLSYSDFLTDPHPYIRSYYGANGTLKTRKMINIQVGIGAKARGARITNNR